MTNIFDVTKTAQIISHENVKYKIQFVANLLLRLFSMAGECCKPYTLYSLSKSVFSYL